MEKKTILLVEDNPDDEILTLRAFKKHNLVNDVVVARDGQEAVDYLFAEGLYAGRDAADLPEVVLPEVVLPEVMLPEIVLLDLKLPKLDGLEVLRRIRADQRTELLPVIILTSSNEEQDLIDSYKGGCNSYVRKPVNFNEFSDAVSQLGLYWLVLNEPPPKARRNSQ